jgi:hypothetical protein
MESTFVKETLQLQERLKELFDENEIVTTNYMAVKKNHDLKRSEFEELTVELEEAKAACQLSIVCVDSLTSRDKREILLRSRK